MYEHIILYRSTSAIPMAIRSVSKLRRTESLGATSMVTLKSSESDTTDDDYTIEGGNNFSELDYKVITEILYPFHELIGGQGRNFRILLGIQNILLIANHTKP